MGEVLQTPLQGRDQIHRVAPAGMLEVGDGGVQAGQLAPSVTSAASGRMDLAPTDGQQGQDKQ